MGDLKDDDVIRLANISRKTFYKYKKELAEELRISEEEVKKEPKEIDLDKMSQKELNKIAKENAIILFNKKAPLNEIFPQSILNTLKKKK